MQQKSRSKDIIHIHTTVQCGLKALIRYQPSNKTMSGEKVGRTVVSVKDIITLYVVSLSQNLLTHQHQSSYV